MIPFEEARDRLLGMARAVGAERVGLEAALGRVLAEDVVAPRSLPAFDQSSMDGYAVSSADLSGPGPWRLPVRGESAAGGLAPPLEPGSACRIFTGAEMPAGADVVVPQEDVHRDGDVVSIRVRPEGRAWIRRRGEDLAEGAVALPRGTRLGAGKIALAAALDRPYLFVARQPVVTIVATGDELRAPGDPPRPGSIPESNATYVALVARAAGAVARIAPYVMDDREAAERAISQALDGSDVVVTIGGVSVGDHDVVKQALEAAGVALDFWRVAIKPGKPLCVGRSASATVLGLPGNPASASLVFLLFGVPLLRALQGDRAPLPKRFGARVVGSLERRPGRTEFLRAVLDIDASGLCARILPNQASGAVTSFAEADALVVVPAERERVVDGEWLEVIRLADV